MSVLRLMYPIIFLLAACGLGSSSESLALATATTVRVEPSTLVPTLAREPHAVASALPIHEAAAGEGCDFSEDEPTVRHTVTANLNYEQRALMVAQRVRMINRDEMPLAEIVFTVEPNLWPRAFTLERVTLGPTTPLPGYELTGRRLNVTLPELLEPGCALEVRLDFRLDVPLIGEDVARYRGYLGYSQRQLNLGHWLPVVAPRIEGNWVTHEAVRVGEQTVLDMADWDVTLNINSASDTLVVAGPGEQSRVSERTWHFFLPAARDFTLSMSDAYHVGSQLTPGGVLVEVYSFAGSDRGGQSGRRRADSAAHALDMAVRSLEMYSDLYGPYPYDQLAVVQGDFPDGMEFTGIVFVSSSWFNQYDGNPAGYLTLITVHEVSHQWWYALVGSDQALTPWLDEALATYSEYIFLEEYYPDLKDWWWSFRVDAFAPAGFVDGTVYQFSSVREYINAVYLLGARMLHDLRADLGTEAFFDLLRRYAEAGRGRIATPGLFWSLLTPEQANAVEATRRRYFSGF